jgi:hypothetical protein
MQTFGVALGLMASVLVAVASPASATGDVSFDGESGTLGGVSTSGGASVSASAARHGTGGLVVSADAAPGFARWNPDVVPQNHTHASVRLWVRLMSRKAGESVDLFTIQNSRRTENFDLFVNGINGRLQWDLYNQNFDGLDTAMEVGRWYLVEAQVEFAAPDYTATVRVDGVNQGTITSNYPGTTIRSVWVGAESNKTHTQHYDDLAVQVGDDPMGWLSTTPPTVNLTSPAEGASYGRGTAVAAAYSCSGYDFAVTSCTGPVANGSAIDTSTLGPHAFAVTATDTAGGTATVTHHYTVTDVTPPTVTITTPAAGAVYNRGAAVTAGYTCADEAGGSGLKPTGGCVGPVANGAALDTTTLGNHDFTVTATDGAGNSTPVTRSYRVVDGVNPSVDLRTPPEGATYPRGSVVAADFSCADDVSVAGCTGTVADGAPIDTVALGSHQFSVTATDGAGNQATVSHSYTVTDVSPPTVELRRPAEGAVFGRGEVVEADFACADETGGSGLVANNGCAGSSPSGGAIDTSILGTHEFDVTATDIAGNATTVTHSYTVVDRTSPVATVLWPRDGDVYARGALVPAQYTCADEVGGSGLRPYASCIGPVAIGSPIDTWTLGDRQFTVTANDAAGNVSWTTNTYTVVQNQPDNLIREASATRFAGDDVYGAAGTRQTAHARVERRRAAVFVLRVQNDTGVTDRFRVRSPKVSGPWQVTYMANGRDVTRAVTIGNYVVGPLRPGQSRALQVVVRPTAWAARGLELTVPVTTSAMAPHPVRDRVRAVVRVR